MSALFFTAIDQENDEQFAKLLPFNIKEQTHLGISALMHSIKQQKIKYAKQLTQSARLQDNNGKTALMMAAEQNYIEGVALLLDLESNMIDKNNQSALIYAVKSDSVQAFLLLFQREYQYLQKAQVIALKYKRYAIINEINEILQNNLQYQMKINISTTNEFLYQKLKEIQEEAELNELEQLINENQQSNLVDSNEPDFIYVNAGKLVTLTTQIQSMQEKLIFDKQEEIRELQAQNQKLLEEIEKQKQEIQEFNKQKHSLQFQLNKNISQVVTQQQTINKLQEDINKSKIDYNNMYKTLQKEVSRTIYQKSQLQQKVQQNKDENLQLKNTIVELQQLNDERNDQILQLSQLKQTQVSQENKYKELVRKYELTIKQLQTDLIQTNIKYDQLNQDIQIKDQQLDVLENTNTALKQALCNLQEQIDAYQQNESERLSMSNGQQANLMLTSIKSVEQVKEEQEQTKNQQIDYNQISNDELFRILADRCPAYLIKAIQKIQEKVQ